MRTFSKLAAALLAAATLATAGVLAAAPASAQPLPTGAGWTVTGMAPNYRPATPDNQYAPGQQQRPALYSSDPAHQLQGSFRGWSITSPSFVVAHYGRMPDGTLIPVYCIDPGIPPGLDQPHTAATVPQYDPSGVRDLPRVYWTLEHSLPALTLAEARAQFGDPNLTEDAILVGTQWAVWHFAGNDTYLAPLADQPAEIGAYLEDSAGNPVAATAEQQQQAQAELAGVLAVYSWLTGARNDGSTLVVPTLTITPPATSSATAGERVGPFTVHTSSGPVALTASPAGATIEDAAGAPISTVADGGQFWVRSGTVGAVTVTTSQVHGTPMGYALLPADASLQRFMTVHLDDPIGRTVRASFDAAPTTPPTTTPPTTTPPTTTPPTPTTPATPVTSPPSAHQPATTTVAATASPGALANTGVEHTELLVLLGVILCGGGMLALGLARIRRG